MTRNELLSEVRRARIAPWLSFLALLAFAAVLLLVIGVDGRGSTATALAMGGVFWIYALRNTMVVQRLAGRLLGRMDEDSTHERAS